MKKVSHISMLPSSVGPFPVPFKYALSAAVDCGSLGNPGNGVVSFTNSTYNSVATYSCNTGYTLTGDDTRTCQSSGLWSGSEPTCTGKQQMTTMQYSSVKRV